MPHDVKHTTQQQNARPDAERGRRRHPRRLLPAADRRAEDVRDLLRVHDEERGVHHAHDGLDDGQAGEAAQVAEQAHGDDRPLNIAEALVQHENDTGRRAGDQQPQDLGRVLRSRRPAPRHAQKEERQPGREQKQADEVDLLDLIALAGLFAVKLDERGRVVEDEEDDRGDSGSS